MDPNVRHGQLVVADVAAAASWIYFYCWWKKLSDNASIQVEKMCKLFDCESFRLKPVRAVIPKLQETSSTVKWLSVIVFHFHYGYSIYGPPNLLGQRRHICLD